MTLRMPVSSFTTEDPVSESENAMPNTSLRDDIFAHVRPLRAHAFLLVGDKARSDDLVEATLRTAWRDFAAFPRGGNMRAWLFTILRGLQVPSPVSGASGPAKADGTGPTDLSARPDDRLQNLAPFRQAFAALPVIQREALLLTVAARFSQDDAATICGCTKEAILDRADHGRQAMADMLAPC